MSGTLQGVLVILSQQRGVVKLKGHEQISADAPPENWTAPYTSQILLFEEVTLLQPAGTDL